MKEEQVQGKAENKRKDGAKRKAERALWIPKENRISVSAQKSSKKFGNTICS